MSQHIRPFLKRISELTPDNSRVLDLGCGKGELLKTLRDRRSINGYGVDIDVKNVKECIRNGISVYQGNIVEALTEFQDQVFDTVILSHTLQEIYEPKKVLNEMLRVGKKAIVTFPNFGHWRIRLNLVLSGHSPRTKTLPYEWHNTPNIRVITIKDFRRLCKESGIFIEIEEPYFRSKWIRTILPKWTYNLFSTKGLFVLKK
ncbi:methionine biosynthesis protein MetW [bacterium]|jgi:methionine biosynthesis protein MetW|nr:methionine biosynthesis protein MetW [bacterium]